MRPSVERASAACEQTSCTTLYEPQDHNHDVLHLHARSRLRKYFLNDTKLLELRPSVEITCTERATMAYHIMAARRHLETDYRVSTLGHSFRSSSSIVQSLFRCDRAWRVLPTWIDRQWAPYRRLSDDQEPLSFHARSLPQISFFKCTKMFRMRPSVEIASNVLRFPVPPSITAG